MIRSVGEGWFIKFEPEETDDLKALEKYLSDNEYEPGAEGIKQLILDTIYEDKDKPRNPILEAIQENPEAVQHAMMGIGKLASKALNAKIFKK